MRIGTHLVPDGWPELLNMTSKCTLHHPRFCTCPGTNQCVQNSWPSECIPQDREHLCAQNIWRENQYQSWWGMITALAGAVVSGYLIRSAWARTAAHVSMPLGTACFICCLRVDCCMRRSAWRLDIRWHGCLEQRLHRQAASGCARFAWHVLGLLGCDKLQTLDGLVPSCPALLMP